MTHIDYLVTYPFTEVNVRPVLFLLTKGFWFVLTLTATLVYGLWGTLMQRQPGPIPALSKHYLLAQHYLVGRWLPTGLAVIVFAALTFWFQHTLPYEKFFYGASRGNLEAHNAARLLFLVYMIVILFGLGGPLLRWAERHGVSGLSGPEAFCIRVIVGSAVLRFVMLALGFANAYHYVVILPLGIIGVILGWADMMELLRGIGPRVRAAWDGRNALERFSLSGLWAALFMALCVVMVRRFVSTDGSGDYYTHYFHYYLHVLQNGGIWPNEVWYHFFISKGVGDIFFAMILTDPLGPVVPSAAMFVLSLTVLYCILMRMTSDVIVALLAITMVAASFIFTNDSVLGLGTWGEFAKQHVITTGLYMGCLWACWMQLNVPKAGRKHWAILTALAYMGLVLMRPQFFFMMSISLGVIGIMALLKRRFDAIVPYVAVGLAGIAVAVGLHVINYAITGIAEVTPFRLFWPYADQEKLSHWISPFLGLVLELGSSPDMGGLSPPDFHHFRVGKLITAMFRLRTLRYYLAMMGVPLIVVTLVLGRMLLARRRLPPVSPAFWEGLGVMLAIMAASGTAFMMLNQVISMYRFMIFMGFVVLSIPALVFFLVRRLAFDKPQVRAVVAIAAMCVAGGAIHRQIRDVGDSELHHQVAFTLGLSTVADDYKAFAAHWAPGKAICEHRPKDAPIYYFTVVDEHFMAPHCLFQTFFSYSMGTGWDKVMFETPEIAKAALQAQGINYFAINSNVATFDPVVYAPLLRPETLDRYFSIVWSENGAYLLTWKQKDAAPPTDKKARTAWDAQKAQSDKQFAQLVAAYRGSIAKAQDYADFKEMYHQLDDVYAGFEERGGQWPVGLNPKVPHPRGWQ